MTTDTYIYDTIPEECSLEDLVITSCRHLHDNIIQDVDKKFLLKDEHYFQGQLYLDLVSRVNDLDPNMKVKLEYTPDMLSNGRVDVAVIDQSEPLDVDLLYINVCRRTKTSSGHFTNEILQMAALSRVADCILVLVTDGREMADLRPPNNYILDRKRKVVFNDIIDEILAARDDFDIFKNIMTNKLNLKDTIPETFRIRRLRSFSFGKREKERFAITVWKIDADEPEEERPKSGSTFLTEVPNGRNISEIYTLKNRLWASHEFELRARRMVYVHSELIMTANGDDKEKDEEIKGNDVEITKTD